ncbi:MAG: ribbon-helix-helix domain-containing protein [Candidatus Binataceae bacterium]
MKRGPKKRVYERISVSLGKGQKRGLENLAEAREMSVADLVRRAVDDAYGKSIRGGRAAV